jgi:hypothetical protein
MVPLQGTKAKAGMDVVIVQVEVRDLRPWRLETRGSRTPG